MNIEDIRCPWGDTLKTCAITVCDLDGVVTYQNARSREIINRLIANGENNTYTIQKGPLRKLIYQTPWYESGDVAGLVEFSLEIPEEMPHYVRG